MNSVEAFNVLMSGKKVRNKEWVKDAYLYYDEYFSSNQWELYKEDERRNTMNFEEAKKLMLEGKKVRCTDWVEGAYIYFDNKNLLVKDNKELIQSYGIYDKLKGKEWELYEEPKKIIKVFISQPMNGRCKCEITEERNKIKKLIEAKYGEDYQIEYLNENLWERPKDWTRIQNLGYSIMNMYDADIVVFAPDWINSAGCLVEHDVALRYGKKQRFFIKEDNGEYTCVNE